MEIGKFTTVYGLYETNSASKHNTYFLQSQRRKIRPRGNEDVCKGLQNQPHKSRSQTHERPTFQLITFYFYFFFFDFIFFFFLFL